MARIGNYLSMHWGNRRPVRRCCALGAGGLATLVIITGCGSSSKPGSPSNQSNATSGASFYTGWPTGGKPTYGGTVNYDEEEAPNSLNPFLASSGGNAVAQVFDELTELLPGSKSEVEVQPALATSWSVSPNHLTWTFHIRKDVRFSNGEPITGEDVAFSLRQQLPATAVAKTLITAWKKVTLVGPMTVQIDLTKPDASLLETLDLYSFAIVPKVVYEREGATKFGLKPIGTGPFTVTHVGSGFTEVVERRNPYYWRKGEPYLNEIVFKQVESPNARVLAVRSGSADVAAAIPYSQVPSLKKTPGVKMLIGPVWGASQVVPDRAKQPFNEVNVRRALMYATPVNQIVKSVYKGLGTPANSLWGRLQYWDSKDPYYPYDLAKAKELLKHSSVPHGFNTVIEITGGETESELLASILQASWAQIGVHASIHSLTFTTLFANFFAGKTTIAVFPAILGYDVVDKPDLVADLYLDNSEPGYGPKASPAFVAKLNKAASSYNEKERATLFGELQQMAYWKEALFMPIVDLASFNLTGDSVRGFQALPSTFVPMQRVWLQK